MSETDRERGQGHHRRAGARRLAHLYDSAYLRDHPLLPSWCLTYARSPGPHPGAANRDHGAISGLRPPPPVVARSREWRPYGILVYRYLDGMSDDKIRAELGISGGSSSAT